MVAERAGRTGFVLNADDPLIADLGRDHELHRRAGRHLLRDRGPVAGAARAPARPRRQALPPLRPPLRLRARLRRPPRPLRVPQLRRRPARARPRRDRDRAARDARLALARLARPTARRARAAAARPLQRLQRARRARRRAAARDRRSRPAVERAGSTVEAAFGRVETIEVGGHAGLDPADQEPGRRQRGPAHAAPRGRRAAAALDLWIALNDRIADGRDVSWVWDADFELLAGAARSVICAGTRAPEMAVRLKYAGIDPATLAVEPSIERSLDRAVAGADWAALRPPDLHGADRAAHAARRPRAGEGVLAMSAAAGRREAIWHDVECGAYAADLATWVELAAAAAGPVLELGAGDRPRRAQPRRARGIEVVALDRSRELARRARRASAAAAGLEIETVRADARGSSLGARASAPCSRRCSSCTCSPARPSAASVLAAVAGAPPARAARSPRRCSPRTLARTGRLRAPGRCPTCASSTAGSTRACRSRSPESPAGSRSAGCARSSRPTGELTESTDAVRLDRAHARRSSSREAAAAGLERARADRDPPHRRPRRLGRSASWRRRDEAPRLLALYPEQMNIYADRGNILFLRRRCEWRGIGFEHAAAGPGERFDPAAHDLIYIGGGQDRDQRLVAADMRRDQARGARRRGRRRRRRARRLRRLPAARPQLPARRRADRRARARRPRDRPRAGPAADRQRRDRGRPRRRAAADRRVREPRRAHPPRRRASSRSAG